MNLTWNTSKNPKNGTFKIWKPLSETTYREIKSMESELQTEAFICPFTSSVVFECTGILEDVLIKLGIEGSQKDLESRYVNPNMTLQTAFKQLSK
jgi:hypothetical protein